MYATLVMFTLGTGARLTAEKLADQYAQIHKTMKGFKSSTFFIDESIGEYGAFSLWQSKDDAESAFASAGPHLQQVLSSIVKEAPTFRIFEVYEPKE